jgi:hypothetical protein
MKINLSHAFASQRVAIKQVEEKIWLVSFMRYDFGYFDHETCRIESAENPFAAKKRVTHVSGPKRHPSHRNAHIGSVAPPAGVEPTTYRLGGGRSIH